VLAVGCGSDTKAVPATTAAAGSTPVSGATAGSSAAASKITPSLLTQEFVAGENNRFSVGLVNASNKLVKGANVHLRFFTIGTDGSSGTFRGEGDAGYVELTVPDAHTHDNSPQGAVTDDSVAFYVANTPFDTAGKWGVEIGVTQSGGDPVTIQAPFVVRQASQSPGFGSTPPASRNDTFATNPNTESLCSRSPACPLHDKVIGDVLGKGRPQYQDRVDFVHIEIWQDFQLQKNRPAVDEWKLPGEPYTFFMDKTGKVVGKLESVFSGEELTSALDQLAKL